MAKSFETKVEITGAIGSSFVEAFRKANSGLVDLRKEARTVQQELDRLNRDFRQGKLHQSQYTEETQKLTKELNNLERAQRKQLENEKRISSIKSGLGTAYDKTKAVAGLVVAGGGVAAAATFVKSVNTAADFEAQMAKVGAKAEATNAEMQALSQTAIKLGASSSLSSSDVAIGMDELAAKGMNARQIMEAMPGLIAATEASGESLDVVSDVVTSAINSFAMEAKEASRVADIIAMSANKSAADVVDLGHAFKYAAPVANTLGISLEELSAATGILTDKGLAGEQAGTALRMALIRLSDPPKDAQKALNKLNISAVDSEDNFKNLAQITEEWNKATQNLSQTQKVAYASTIFGTEASTAMLNLFEAGPDAIREMTKALEESGGAAEEAARKMKDNFAGAKEQLFGAIESSQIAFASPILPVLQDTFEGITATIENNLPEIENAGKAVAKVIDDITAPFQIIEPPKPEITPEMNRREIEQAMLEFEKEYGKPVKPEITPDMNWREAETALMQYHAQIEKHEKYLKQLEEYELFSNMSFSEKIEYSLNETVETIDRWMQGEGGEVLDSIFTNLGTLAGKAWVKAFTTAVTGSVESIGEGNIVGGVALAAAANMMTGGLLMKGGVSGGKWLLGKGKDVITNRKSKKAIETTDISNTATLDATVKSSKRSEKNKKGTKGKGVKATSTIEKVADSTSKATRVTNKAPNKGATKALSKFGKISKGAGKAFAPLALLGYGADILTSDDKSQAIGSAVGGLGGGLAGAAAGAAIGSVVPIVGTAVGGLIGSIVGGLGGDWIGGKIGGLFGGSEKASASPVPTSDNAVASIDVSPLNAEINKAVNNISILTANLGQASGMVYGSFYPLQEQTNLVSNNMSTLTMYTGQASGMIYGSFYPLQEQTNLATHNMSTLVSYLGQASGWINSLSNIQTAGERVVEALNNLEQRINALEFSGGSRRVSYE